MLEGQHVPVPHGLEHLCKTKTKLDTEPSLDMLFVIKKPDDDPLAVECRNRVTSV